MTNRFDSLIARLRSAWKRTKQPTAPRAYRCQCERPVFFRNSECLACKTPLGYEPDLRSVLIDRPRGTVLNPAWPWAVWYPLRRNGRFTQLSAEEQRIILAEHGEIGMRFGAADYVHDVRLACHGLDRDDNDFVIGLIGKDLYPLSAIVQVMRKTQQTSLYLDRLGPFFVGRAVWQTPIEPASP